MLCLVRNALCAAVLSLPIAGGASAAPAEYGQQLQGFAYPYPLHYYSFSSQGEALQMGYMDVAAQGRANGQVVVLLHGKNFCAATWEDQINALSRQGYRVVAPDQIGFCSSSKPAHYQYSFQQLATNTRDLLAGLGIDKVMVVGHSTGGMLATRYALMFPARVGKLVLVNPIGLEDWQAMGVPYRTVDQWYQRELNTTAQSIHQYELTTYYVGRWKPQYDRWVDMLAGLNQGPGHKLVAWNSALIYDMIFTQPVFYEFGNLQVPTTLMIGTSDTTAIGSDIASPAVKATLGHYDRLGKQIAGRIPGARLIEFKGLGHAPQMEQPTQFNQALLEALRP
ncbi:alpha/beta fold hydrolase [Sodalis sp. RH21]|uniref:alpha/beta fold hydrolase n=1 Tax=unclassified Sodalis (in: enterobacteria) TaxID=2636512 RepID=UPI0039B620ED